MPNKENRPTFATVKADLATHGITIRKRDGEYRVNVANGSEATAYYTDDLEDAWGTGLATAAYEARKAAQLRRAFGGPDLTAYKG